MVDELLAARGIVVSHETVRQWALKFGQSFADQIRRRLRRRAGAVIDRHLSRGQAMDPVAWSRRCHPMPHPHRS